MKKMLQEGALWYTRKRLLGWDLNTEVMTLNLPPHRLERLQEVLSWIQPPHKRLPTKLWHQLLGELRSMLPALPGTRGLFSTLQEALSKGDRRRVRLNRHVSMPQPLILHSSFNPWRPAQHGSKNWFLLPPSPLVPATPVNAAWVAPGCSRTQLLFPLLSFGDPRFSMRFVRLGDVHAPQWPYLHFGPGAGRNNCTQALATQCTDTRE